MDTEDFNADVPEEQVPSASTQSTTLQTLTTEQSVLEETPEVVAPEKKPPTTPLQDSLRKLRRDKRAMVSVGIILFFLILPIIGPPLYQHIGGPIDSTTGG